MPDFPIWLTEHMPAVVAGACGGVIRTLRTPHKNVSKFFSDIVAGCILAVYVGPIAARIMLPAFDMVDLPPEAAERTGAFLAGFGGMMLVEAIDVVLTRRSKRIENGE